MEVRNLTPKDSRSVALMLSKYQFRYLGDSRLPVEGNKRFLLDQINSLYSKYPESSFIAVEHDSVLGLAICLKSLWDTEHFGFNVGNIAYLISSEKSFVKELEIQEYLLEAVQAWCIKEQIRFLFVRVDSNDLATIHALEENGFRFIEDILYFRYDFDDVTKFNHTRYNVRPFQSTDLEALIAIARSTFTNSRFHRDPHIDRRKADGLYERWIQTICAQEPNHVSVIEVDGKPVGFTIYEIKNLIDYFGKRIMVWRLAGISEDQKGKGIGYDLYLGTLNIVRNKADIVYGSSASVNVPSVKLLLKLGFKFVSSSLTFHKWF